MTLDRLRILMVEDDEDHIFLVKKTLEKGKAQSVSFEAVGTIGEALERIKKGDIDIVLLDLFLPDSRGLDTLQTIRAAAPDLPVVVLTSLDDESAALEAVSHGAQDYLVKGELGGSFFLRTLRHAVERQRIRIELNETNSRLEQLALVDPLTGLLNRRGLQQILSGQIPRVSRDSELLALLIDLDDFKRVNDTLGHAVGDIVLNEITNRLKTSLRSSDHAARIGGDEFVLLLPETRFAEGFLVAEKVRLAISGNPVILSKDNPIKVTASLGLVIVPPATTSIDELLIATHAALAKSKRAGKNQVSYEMRRADGVEMETDFRNMHSRLLHGSYRVMRQAIHRLADSKNVGFEFLSRSKIKHFESPDDFFRLSVENNILTLVDHACLKACLSSAAAVLPSGARCHLNLFPSTLIDIPVNHLVDELKATREDIQYCIEISEQQIIGDPSYLLPPVNQLKESGCLVAIDDVGFGRSCFESLILLEPTIIKIDKGCVIGVAKDRARVRSLKRILNVARVLEAEVIAEGVEDKEDLDVLRELGVEFGQGFFLDALAECNDRVAV